VPALCNVFVVKSQQSMPKDHYVQRVDFIHLPGWLPQ